MAQNPCQLLQTCAGRFQEVPPRSSARAGLYQWRCARAASSRAEDTGGQRGPQPAPLCAGAGMERLYGSKTGQKWATGQPSFPSAFKTGSKSCVGRV